MSDMVINVSKMRDMCKPFNIASDFDIVLDQKVKELVKQAKDRAEANHRKTVMGKDL